MNIPKGDLKEGILYLSVPEPDSQPSANGMPKAVCSVCNIDLRLDKCHKTSQRARNASLVRSVVFPCSTVYAAREHLDTAVSTVCSES